MKHRAFLRVSPEDRRDYDPAVGRFTARDPMRDTRGDGDLYDYCVDDPVSNTDSNGLWTKATFREENVNRDRRGRFDDKAQAASKDDLGVGLIDRLAQQKADEEEYWRNVVEASGRGPHAQVTALGGGITPTDEEYGWLRKNIFWWTLPATHPAHKDRSDQFRGAMAKKGEEFGKGMMLHRYTWNKPLLRFFEGLFPEIAPPAKREIEQLDGVDLHRRHMPNKRKKK